MLPHKKDFFTACISQNLLLFVIQISITVYLGGVVKQAVNTALKNLLFKVDAVNLLASSYLFTHPADKEQKQ